MKNVVYALVLSLIVGAGLAWSDKGHDGEHGAGGKAVTVKGELVDMACYMAHEGKGAKHAKCAKMCIVGGSPLGILTTDGKVYLLVENHASAKTKKPYATARELIAETVTIKGDAYERGGTQAIVVESVTQE